MACSAPLMMDRRYLLYDVPLVSIGTRWRFDLAIRMAFVGDKSFDSEQDYPGVGSNSL